MTVTGGSSGGGSSSSSSSTSDRDNPTKKNNLTGSLSAGTIGTPQVDKGTPVSLNQGSSDGKAVVDIRPTNTSIVGGASSTPSSIYESSSGGSGRGGAIDTTVTQQPAAGATDGAEGTVVTNGPRSDFSVVLAGQVGKRPDRSAARSNNFVSLVGGAGGLGRKTSDAKRSLIGGA